MGLVGFLCCLGCSGFTVLGLGLVGFVRLWFDVFWGSEGLGWVRYG